MRGHVGIGMQGCLQIDSIDFDCFDSIDRFDSIDSCLFGVSVGYLGVCLGFLGGSVPVWVMPGGCPGVLIDRFDRFDSFDFMIDSIDVRYYCVYGGLGLGGVHIDDMAFGPQEVRLSTTMEEPSSQNRD